MDRGALVVEQANKLFSLDIWDPPRSDHRILANYWRSTIEDMIAGPDGLGWIWEEKYLGDGDFEWCGAFAARCYAAAGMPLRVRKTFFASTYRLQRWASYRPFQSVTNDRPPSGPYRLCVPLDEHSTSATLSVEPHPGDILLVGGVRSGPGKHVTIVESFDGHVFRTIEGNASGLGPDKKRRQGIVKNFRSIGLLPGMPPTTYHPRWLIRPVESDYTP